MATKLPQANFATLPVSAKVVLLFALLILITSGYYVGMHMGIEEKIQAEQRRHQVLQNDLKQAHERQKEYLRLREELAGREALDRQNMRILPETAEIPAFLDDLNRLAELSGLTVASVGPRPEASEQFFVRVPVALSVQGRYHQLAKFFYNVSRLERAINMENLSLTGAKTSTGSEDVTLTVNVLATTFRRPDGKEASPKGKAKGK